MPNSFAGIWRKVPLFVLLVPLFSRGEFYSFTESTRSQWLDPSEIISEAKALSVNLLKWTFHSVKRPEALEKYNRLKHFGTWVDDPRTKECYDTRALTLIRDSKTDVKFSKNNPCRVSSGEWLDPYSGEILKKATPDIQIDHVVALKNAYDSGAWTWDYQHRCLFANFLGYNKHLMSVSAFENNKKGDRGPEDWMPSDKAYACQHLQNWLAVKYVWNLNMTEAEAEAVQNEIQKNHCHERQFQFSKNEIIKIRKFAKANLALCSAH